MRGSSELEEELRQYLRGRLGVEAYHDLSQVFGLANGCWAEGARSHDAGAFFAACVMARQTLESAFFEFETCERTVDGWKLLRPEIGESGKLENQSFEYWYSRVKEQVPFSEDIVAAVGRIKGEGDLSAHLAQRFSLEFWKLETIAEQRQAEARRLRAEGKAVKEEPLMGGIVMPGRSESHRNLTDAVEVLAQVAFYKRHGAALPSLAQSHQPPETGPD